MERWSIEQTSSWYARLPWLCGFNTLPRTAVNWTEMWQRDGFDPATIEQELGWAQLVGFALVPHLRDDERLLAWDLYKEPGNEFCVLRTHAPPASHAGRSRVRLETDVQRSDR